MHALFVPDHALVSRWLEQMKVETYVCEHCSGLHFAALQSINGVLDSKLDVLDGLLLFTTNAEVRPSALFNLTSRMGQLNMDYPQLKIFVELRDDALPVLYIAATLDTRSGITEEQFAQFVNSCVKDMETVLQDCKQQGALFFPEEDLQHTHSAPALH